MWIFCTCHTFPVLWDSPQVPWASCSGPMKHIWWSFRQVSDGKECGYLRHPHPRCRDQTWPNSNFLISHGDFWPKATTQSRGGCRICVVALLFSPSISLWISCLLCGGFALTMKHGLSVRNLLWPILVSCLTFTNALHFSFRICEMGLRLPASLVSEGCFEQTSV